MNPQMEYVFRVPLELNIRVRAAGNFAALAVLVAVEASLRPSGRWIDGFNSASTARLIEAGVVVSGLLRADPPLEVRSAVPGSRPPFEAAQSPSGYAGVSHPVGWVRDSAYAYSPRLARIYAYRGNRYASGGAFPSLNEVVVQACVQGHCCFDRPPLNGVPVGAHGPRAGAATGRWEEPCA